MRRIGLTTWIVLIICLAVGVIAATMTVVVIVRLNRQLIASAAELRANLVATPGVVTEDSPRSALVDYAQRQAAVEAQWAAAIADYQVRYANSPVYESIATAQTRQKIDQMMRPPMVAQIHERWAQAWSERDRAYAILAQPTVTEEEREQAAELARAADDEIRRLRNELRDLLIANGVQVTVVPSPGGATVATP